jgi:hypothetical protein
MAGEQPERFWLQPEKQSRQFFLRISLWRAGPDQSAEDQRSASSEPNETVFPVLRLNGPCDTDDRGRWIPTASLEQYAATLATWFGVAEDHLRIVLPNSVASTCQTLDSC